MRTKFFRLSFAVMAGILLLSNWSCTKIDTTDLGADLIPAVDNIHTFADTFFIDGIAGNNIDTTSLSRTENHLLGSINNDPVFGKTKADIFFELKPGSFPYTYGDTINSALNSNTHFDSVILCLAYKGFYGDSTIAQKFSVYALDPNTSNFKKDSAYKLNFQPDVPYTNLVGQATLKPTDVNKQIFFRYGKDSVTNQIRIKLSTAFLNTITSFDSSNNAAKNAYKSDSIFKTFFKGFAVVADNGSPGNGLFYVNLADPLTRLEIHYTKKNGTPLDTAYASWNFSTGTSLAVSPSANANNLQRDYSSAEFATAPQADALYIQTAPGSAINLSIPELTSYPNRIIHRAELILEQVPEDPILDKVLTPPAFLYLDLVDDTANPQKYKPVYYDLSPNSFYNPDDRVSFFPSGGVDFSYYGGSLKTITDASGTKASYTFNLTRYVQNLVTRKYKNYKMRVYAPYELTYYGLSLSYSNSLAFGRVKLGNGNNPNYKLRMRIVYSNL